MYSDGGVCAGCTGVVITFITVQTAANLPLGSIRTPALRLSDSPVTRPELVLVLVVVGFLLDSHQIPCSALQSSFKSLAKFSCSFLCAFL